MPPSASHARIGNGSRNPRPLRRQRRCWVVPLENRLVFDTRLTQCEPVCRASWLCCGRAKSCLRTVAAMRAPLAGSERSWLAGCQGLESRHLARRRRDRVAEGAPLLREYAGKTCIVGSNPTVSAREGSESIHRGMKNRGWSFRRLLTLGRLCPNVIDGFEDKSGEPRLRGSEMWAGGAFVEEPTKNRRQADGARRCSVMNGPSGRSD